MPTRYAYLHGFASSPLSAKGVALAQRLASRGVTLERPDLNAPSFAKLTITGSLGVLDSQHDRATRQARAAGDDDPVRWRLVGSSMGGYLAARWAELHPERVEALLLLCPGFQMNERWPKLFGVDAIASWRAHGWHAVPDATGKLVRVHWGFLQDAIDHHPPIPTVPCPTRIVHGRRDEVVPVETSRAYAATHPDRVTLVEVDDDHGLAASLDRIEAEALTLFGL